MLRKLITTSVITLALCMAATVHAQGTGTDSAEPAAAGDPAGAGGDTAAGTGTAAPATGAATTDVEQPAAAPGGAASTGAYRVQLKDLEQRVNELKERIFRSKARLNLLKETVLHGVIAGSRAIIKHKNDMGSSFKLVKLVYSIDGQKIFSKVDSTGSLDDKKEFEVYNGSIVPGNHTISVVMEFKGHGFGIFSYLKGYTFKVRSSHTITAGEGRQTNLTVRAYEKGNITTELKDRPAIDFKVNLLTIGKGGSQ